ncbi:RNA polymerase sigma factor, partial [Acrocarpospora macrocephala]|uniref:RNA polymerase sigma factor n=2 Tax=Acrocarpospora macrocephala TaxID=150177 RepID=UPI0014794AEF
MNDRVLVEALRDRDPGALAELYDSHAESIYRFCWAMLGSADGAQVALRDTLIAAEARIASLADPEQLRAWLFALARGECARRRMPGFVITDDTDPAGMAVPASGEADDDLRVTAWNATQALSVDDREILELSTRHDLSGPDLAAALGRPVRQAESLREAATERLRDAVTAEVLAGKGPHDCPKRAKILEGHTGDLTTETREQLVRHIARCDTCKPHRDRQISTAKVFALLPSATLPDTLRVRVMSCFIDPELVPYRTYVARRVGTLDPNGFPIANETPARRWPLLALGTAAAIAAAVATVIAFTQLATTSGEQIIGTASGLFPSTPHQPTPKITKSPKPSNKPLDLREILEISQRIPIRPDSATHPIPTKAPPSRPNPTLTPT